MDMKNIKMLNERAAENMVIMKMNVREESDNMWSVVKDLSDAKSFPLERVLKVNDS